MWTLGCTEKEEMIRFTIKMMRICKSRSLSVVCFESSFRLKHLQLEICPRKKLKTKKKKKPSNLLWDICIGQSDSPECTRDPNTPPSPSP